MTVTRFWEIGYETFDRLSTVGLTLITLYFMGKLTLQETAAAYIVVSVVGFIGSVVTTAIIEYVSKE